jgi:hypothetical protein
MVLIKYVQVKCVLYVMWQSLKLNNLCVKLKSKDDCIKSRRGEMEVYYYKILCVKSQSLKANCGKWKMYTINSKITKKGD